MCERAAPENLKRSQMADETMTALTKTLLTGILSRGRPRKPAVVTPKTTPPAPNDARLWARVPSKAKAPVIEFTAIAIQPHRAPTATPARVTFQKGIISPVLC